MLRDKKIKKFLLKCWQIFQVWIQKTSEIFFRTRRKVSYLHVMFNLLVKQRRDAKLIRLTQNTECHKKNAAPQTFCLHCLFILLFAKCAISYVIIAKVNFSTVKAMCYLTWQDTVCAQKLTWYFFDKCLYNQNPQFTPPKQSAPLLPTIPG